MEFFASNWEQQLQIAYEVLVATAFGGLIGFERELAKKPAGLRTHALVAAMAALFVGITDVFLERFAGGAGEPMLRVDPIRVVEAIVTGVAFIGAGTIFRHRERQIVEGLTTAASLLVVAGMAVAVALGQVLLAGAVTVLSLVVLQGLGRIEKVGDR